MNETINLKQILSLLSRELKGDDDLITQEFLAEVRVRAEEWLENKNTEIKKWPNLFSAGLFYTPNSAFRSERASPRSLSQRAHSFSMLPLIFVPHNLQRFIFTASENILVFCLLKTNVLPINQQAVIAS